MTVETFHLQDKAYARWRGDHPEGYVLAVRPNRAPTLHRAGCAAIRGGSSGRALTRTPRVCSSDRDELEAWARAEGRMIVPCAACTP